MKDDSGTYAVSTEQGSSAPQMAAAKIVDVIARLPGCEGQAADSVSAYTQVKMEDVPQLLKNSKVRMSRCLDTSSTTQHGQNHRRRLRIPWYLLNEIFMGIPYAGLPCERQFETALLELGWDKIPNWECVFVHRKQGLFLSVYVEDIKMTRKKKNVAPRWKKLMKNVDIGEPTSFLDHVYLGCTQRECKPNETILEQYTKMFESRISDGATENYRDVKNLTHKPQRGLAK